MRRRGALIALLAAGSLGCQSLSHWVATPGHPFDPQLAPPPPDYARAEAWAALPGRDSAADAVPPGSGAVDAQATAEADVFFVHPTTYFWRSHWNAPTGGWLTRRITAATLAGQASAFNGAARVYAPRYRQMTLAGFDHPELREAALDLAYSDVRRAFQHYLDRFAAGRPLILAGHSQGSRMLLRLLDDFFRDGPLREHLVAAYVVGARVWEGSYQRGEAVLPVCQRPEATGCLVSWRTLAEGADPAVDSNPGERSDGQTVCVNPLSWRPGGAAPADANLGSVPLPTSGALGRALPGLTGARCQDGFLWIRPVTRAGFRMAHPDGNWHAYDYALFYMNVRANAVQRVAAFTQRSRP